MTRCVLVLAMLAAAAPARADDVVVYETEGDSIAGTEKAKEVALDDAFARAVTMAINELVAADVRTAHKSELDKEIVGHARRWVPSYGVTKDEVNDTRRQLTVSVRVDRDKIRARLGELSIASIASPQAVVPEQRTVTVLLRVATPTGARASFGEGGEREIPGVAALTNLFRNAGLAVRRAPASGPAARDGELPIDDDGAAALASEARAEQAAVAAVTVAPPIAVRGQAGSASLVTARLRLVDRDSKKAIAQASAVAAALSPTTRADEAARPADADPGMIGYAIDRALGAAASDVIPPAPQKITQAGAFHGEDTPIGEPGVVLLRLPAKTPPGMVTTEVRYLSGARGVRSATLHRVSPAGWVIGVATSESIDRIAAIAKKPPATDTFAAVKIVGDIIEVELSGSP